LRQPFLLKNGLNQEGKRQIAMAGALRSVSVSLSFEPRRHQGTKDHKVFAVPAVSPWLPLIQKSRFYNYCYVSTFKNGNFTVPEKPFI
jgi:hypothetical protein